MTNFEQASGKISALSNQQQPPPSWPGYLNQVDDVDKDHFIEHQGIRFAGYHLILDMWGAQGLDNLELMESAFRLAVREANATLLHIHLHHFTPNGGISGVAVLAESHISVHTWPEYGYAAFDVFMCGDAKPYNAINVLKQAFNPTKANLTEHQRGRSDK